MAEVTASRNAAWMSGCPPRATGTPMPASTQNGIDNAASNRPVPAQQMPLPSLPASPMSSQVQPNPGIPAGYKPTQPRPNGNGNNTVPPISQ